MTIKELIDRCGLAQIHERTRISNDNLLNLLNEDYDILSKANALGFIKIIEREFEVDLKTQKQKIKESMQDQHYVPKELLVTERRYGGRKKVASGAILFIVLVLIIGYIFYLMTVQNGSQQVAQPQDQVTEPQEVVPADELVPSEVETESTQAKPQDVEALLESESEDKQKVQEVATEPKQASQEAVAEVETQSEPIEQSVTDTTQVQQSVLETIELDESPLLIMPERRMWLGHVSLDSQQRTQRNTDGPIVIEDNNSIIVTGHGRFDVEQRAFRIGDRVYMHYIDDTLKIISKEAFKQMNEGRIW